MLTEGDTFVGNRAARCVASNCMMWREGVFKHQRNLPEQDRTPNVGFCGLAGRPE